MPLNIMVNWDGQNSQTFVGIGTLAGGVNNPHITPSIFCNDRQIPPTWW